MQQHPLGTHPCDVNPDRDFCFDREGGESERRRRRRRKEMRNENITHWVEPWQSESLSEMVPRGRETEGGREMEWDCLPV